MSATNNFVFKGLLVLAWIIFIGLAMEAGGLIVNFIVSLFKPAFIPNLYQSLDLTELHKGSPMAFFGIYGFILFISVLKAILFLKVVLLMHKMDLMKPFSAFVSRQILQISHYTIGIGLFSIIGSRVAKGMEYYSLQVDSLQQFWSDGQAYVLMGAVIYIIGSIFKKGVDLQSENELTV